MNKIVLLIVLFLFSSVSLAESVESILKKMKSSYATSKLLEYDCTYELFKGESSTTVHTSYNGYVYKEGDLVYQKINDTELIYGADFFLKIGGEEKVIVLEKAQKSINLDVDLESVLKECSEKSFVQENGFYTIKLVLNPTSQVPFSVVLLRINEKTFFLDQIDMFYSTTMDFSIEMNKKDEAQPHIKIRFNNTTLEPVLNSSVLKLSTYLKSQNNIFSPIGKYAEFELINNQK